MHKVIFEKTVIAQQKIMKQTKGDQGSFVMHSVRNIAGQGQIDEAHDLDLMTWGERSAVNIVENGRKVRSKLFLLLNN